MWNEQEQMYYVGQGSTNATVNFNTAGAVPSGGSLIGTQCGYYTIEEQLAGELRTYCDHTFNNSGTSQVIVSITGDTPCESCYYNHFATVTDIRLIVTYWGLTQAPLLTAPAFYSPPVYSQREPLPVTLSWQAVSGATSYDVYAGTNFDVLPVVGSTSGTSYTLQTLQPDTSYWWKVVARNGADFSPASNTGRFVTVPLPSQVTQSAPVNGATNQPLSSALSWAASAYATTYDVYFGTSNPLPFVGSVTGTSHPVGGLSTSTAYYWRVVAKNSAGSAPASATWSFVTVPPPPPQVTLSAPANGVTGQPTNVALVWNAAPGAASYDVYLGTSNPPPFAVNVAGTSYSPGFSAATTYYWKVVAKDSGGSAPESATRSFRIISGTVATPGFSPGGGTYTSGQSVTISTSTPGATIRYTTDGSTPSSTAGTVYSGPIAVNATMTVRAIAYAADWFDSAVASAAYAITGTVETPVFSLAPGTYTASQSVALSTATAGATIRYTTDGSTPSATSGTVYGGPIAVSSTMTVRAIAYKTDWANSAIASATYTITGTVAAPAFNPPAGTYTSSQSVTLSSGTSGATIRYTNDGSTPTATSGTVYSGAIAVNGTMTIRAIAYKTDWVDSTVTSAAYNMVAATPVFSPAPGTYTTGQSVSISSTAGASIRYTTNGSTPTPSTGTVYTGPIAVSASVTIQAIAYLSGWSDSAVATGAYTITGSSGVSGLPGRGVKSTGAYWGTAGEQIDLLTGNLNFSVPVARAVRTGWGVTFALSYNSQMWHQNGSGQLLLGRDAGYGLGWSLQAGSIRPNPGHYVFTDATGAEYKLDVVNNGVWTSRDGIYVSYEQVSSRLYFPDGSFWLMDVESAAGEPDAGTRYPRRIQDTNGNYIEVQYAAGSGAGVPNTSGRVTGIVDARRGTLPSFTFTYNADPIPHLTAMTNHIGGESYTFSYLNGQTVVSPFTGAAMGTAALLQAVTTNGLNIATSFQYGLGTGEMTQMTTPLGGVLSWSYRTYTYSGNFSYREVLTRQMAPGAGGASNTWNFTLDNSASLHTMTTVSDVGAGTSKVWRFTAAGLPSVYEDRTGTGTLLMRKNYTWINDSTGRPYVGTTFTTLQPNTTVTAVSKTEQTLDAYGNLKVSRVYDYNSLTAPARTYEFTYLHEVDANYAPWYIRNRVKKATVKVGADPTPTTLEENWYDGLGHPVVAHTSGFIGPFDCGGLQNRIGLLLHESAYDANFRYRGNRSFVQNLRGKQCTAHEISGVPYRTIDGEWRTVDLTPGSGTGFTLPSVITPNGNASLATSISYANSFAVTSVSGPNGATSTTNYDAYGRPINSTIADGAQTTYSYTYNPNTQTATLGTRWKKTTVDGFGRTVKVETGHGGTTVSVVDTEYAACACSPLGKVRRVSNPHAPGAAALWTTYTYDASGRTATVTAPDNSVTTYLYQGNSTRITDPAGKWKKQTSDVFGNLVMVTEPNPAGGEWVTNYTYNFENKLTGVAMPRNGYTQTRTFVWSGGDLISETHPESGTKTYEYNGRHQVTKRTDAKGQETRYIYDTYGRLTQVQHWVISIPNCPTYPFCGQAPVEQLNQRVDYYYDTNPITPGFSLNTWGRLAAVAFRHSTPGDPKEFSYQYSYNAAGRVLTQRMQMANAAPSPVILDATYGWDNEGRMTSLGNPGDTGSGGSGPLHTYTFDAMGRTNGYMGGTSNPGAIYGVAGELINFNGETRTYNSLLQLTRISAPGQIDIEYRYAAGQNNGRITSQKDWITGEEVTYTYDALNRLASASATNPSWSQTYTYDGFGNKGAADPATNRQPGVTYDANGNPSGYGDYDVENRLVTDAGKTYTYDHQGKRVFREWQASQMQCELYFYGITGQKLATYQCGQEGGGGSFFFGLKSRNEYLLGKPVTLNGMPVRTDRLGSVRWHGSGERFNYYPYGEERGTTANGREKFGTYFRDESGLDYADQRYYQPGAGRFLTPDPLGVGSAADPSSWNKYAYVGDDPVNFADPSGNSRIQMVRGTCHYSGNSPEAEKSRVRWTEPCDVLVIDYPSKGPDSPKVESPRRNDPCVLLPDGRTIGVSGALGILGGVSVSAEVVFDYHTGHATFVVSVGFGASGQGAGANFSNGYIFGEGNAVPQHNSGGSTVVAATLPGGLNISATMNSGGMTGNPLQLDAVVSTAVQAGFGVGITSLLGGLSAGAQQTTYTLDLGSFITGPAAALTGGFQALDNLLFLMQQACDR